MCIYICSNCCLKYIHFSGRISLILPHTTRIRFCSLSIFISPIHFTYHFNITLHNFDNKRQFAFFTANQAICESFFFFAFTCHKKRSKATICRCENKFAVISRCKQLCPLFFTFARRMDGFSFALCARYNDNCASIGDCHTVFEMATASTSVRFFGNFSPEIAHQNMKIVWMLDNLGNHIPLYQFISSNRMEFCVYNSLWRTLVESKWMPPIESNHSVRL